MLWPWLIGGAVGIKLLPEQCSARNAVADWKSAQFAAERTTQALTKGKLDASSSLVQQMQQLTNWAASMAALYAAQEAVAQNPLMLGDPNVDACKLKDAAAKYYSGATQLLQQYRNTTGDTSFAPAPKPAGMDNWSWKDVAFWGAVAASAAYVVRGYVNRYKYDDPPGYARR